MNSTNDSPENSRALTSFEFGLTNNPNSRASQFIATSLSSPVHDKFTFNNEIKKQNEAIDTAINDRNTISKKVEEERSTYNAATRKVRISTTIS